MMYVVVPYGAFFSVHQCVLCLYFAMPFSARGVV